MRLLLRVRNLASRARVSVCKRTREKMAGARVLAGPDQAGPRFHSDPGLLGDQVAPPGSASTRSTSRAASASATRRSCRASASPTPRTSSRATRSRRASTSSSPRTRSTTSSSRRSAPSTWSSSSTRSEIDFALFRQALFRFPRGRRDRGRGLCRAPRRAEGDRQGRHRPHRRPRPLQSRRAPALSARA